VAVRQIGQVIAGGGGSVLIADANGNRRPATGHGWNHFSAS